MPRFSERIRNQSAPVLQIDSINQELQNSMWNLLLELYDEKKHNYWYSVALHIAKYFRKFPTDDLPPPTHKEMRIWIKKYYYHDLIEWYEIYDFLEFIVENHNIMTHRQIGQPYDDIESHEIDTNSLVKKVNHILERERSGYRFIQGTLSPITDPVEIQEVDNAINAAQKSGLTGAREHLRKANEFLGKKPEPEYRNSIKESISAVETVARQIAGPNIHDLSPALQILKDKTVMDPTLLNGFGKLYGFTCGKEGIRHALMKESDERKVGFPEAKYMLVSCSAFVHYLIVKADDAGLLKKDSST